eukprot:CAMPEP_0176414508 /NCGR_PEP_ID=MMETSP0127-20121128/5294_1 /TAXON_ID=938130 /ORGANISM="Platyophrya macrostoma, Strain WH" /LENGTH=97 /DNA_ID=CAMNT_0017794409 /DNA_START=46 /DNA_END=339 /DNA_ORIENTATION=-
MSTEAIPVLIQLSLGRFPVVVDPNDTIRAAKKKFRFSLPIISQVNPNTFHLYYNGAYLTDESKTVASYQISKDATLYYIKKTACPAAAVDTEKKVEE